MTNTELAARIKRIMEDPEGVGQEELAELARLYALRCRQTDEGFGRANATLQAGMLCETDRLLRDEKLHEDYMTLMFDEFDDWQNVCRALDLEVPAGISRDAGAGLFVFELEYEGVRDLFEQYRRQELERASVEARVTTLHAIKSALSNYPEVFHEPLTRLERDFDAAVAKEIPSIPVSPKGLARLNALYAELVSEARETRPDEIVVRAALAKIEYMNNVASLARLQGLLERWRCAQVESDFIQYYRAFQNEDFTGALSVAPPQVATELQGLIDMTRQVERDIDAREKLRVKLNQLENALDHSDDVDNITNLFHEVEFAAAAAGKSTPRGVVERKEKKVGAIMTQTRRKRFFVIGVVCLVVALFAFLTYATISKSQLRSDATELAAQITAALDAYETKNQYEQLAVAGGLVDNCNPRFMEVPDFVSVAERYRVAQKADEKRAADFIALRDNIEDEHDAGRSATGKLAQLKKLVRTNDEQIQYNEAYKADLNLSQAGQSVANEKYKAKLDAIAADVKKLESIVELTEQRREIARLKTELKNLADDEKSSSVPAALVTDRKSLEATVAGFDKALKENAVFQETLGALTQAIGSKDRYAAALDKLATELKSTPSSTPEEEDTALKTVQNAQSALQSVDAAAAWNQFVVAYPTVAAVASDSSAFKTVYDKLESLSFAEESVSLNKKIESVKDFAERGGFAEAENKLASAFKKYSRPLWTIYVDNKYYYVTSDPNRSTNFLKYLKTVDGSPEDLNESEIKGGTYSVAIQYNVSKAVASNLNGSLEGWNMAVQAAIAALSESDVKKADPAFRLALLADLARSVEKFPGYDELSTFMIAAKSRANVDVNVNFYLPSETLAQARVGAVAALRDLPDLDKIKAQGALAFNELNAPCGQRYEWIGFLDVENEGIVLRRKSLPQENGSFWIAPGAGATVIKCADYKNGEILWTTTKDWQEFRWTPVYFRKDAHSKP